MQCDMDHSGDKPSQEGSSSFLDLAYLHCGPFVQWWLFLLLGSLANVRLPIESSDDVNSVGPKGGSLVTNFATLAACRKVDDLSIPFVFVAFGVEIKGDFPGRKGLSERVSFVKIPSWRQALLADHLPGLPQVHCVGSPTADPAHL